MWWQKERLKQLQAREHPGWLAKHQNLGRGKEGFAHVDFRESVVLPTPWFQTSNLKSKIIYLYCFKPSSLSFCAAKKWMHYLALCPGRWPIQAVTTGFLSHLVQLGQNKVLAGNARAVGEWGCLFNSPSYLLLLALTLLILSQRPQLLPVTLLQRAMPSRSTNHLVSFDLQASGWYLLLHKKISSTQWPETTYILYFKVPVSQESGVA